MRHLSRRALVILLGVLVLSITPSWTGHDVGIAAVPGTGGCGHPMAVLSMPPDLGAVRAHSSFLRVTARAGTPTPVVKGIFHPPRIVL